MAPNVCGCVPKLVKTNTPLPFREFSKMSYTFREYAASLLCVETRCAASSGACLQHPQRHHSPHLPLGRQPHRAADFSGCRIDGSSGLPDDRAPMTPTPPPSAPPQSHRRHPSRPALPDGDAHPPTLQPNVVRMAATRFMVAHRLRILQEATPAYACASARRQSGQSTTLRPGQLGPVRPVHRLTPTGHDTLTRSGKASAAHRCISRPR